MICDGCKYFMMCVRRYHESGRQQKCENFESDRPHGEWKRISMDKYIRHASCFYRCSVCGEDTIGEVNFCPNCGADMRDKIDDLAEIIEVAQSMKEGVGE